MRTERCTTTPGLRVAAARAVFAAIAFAGMTMAAQAAVNISSKPTKNMSCSAGVCTPTSKKAILNVTDLANMLQASDVKVTTGNGAITIEVTAAFSWASANRLTLDANCNVSIKAPVTVAGTGALTVVTNDGGSGCDLLFSPGGKIDFWDLSSSLIVNGSNYKLVNDIATLADDIQGQPAGFFALAVDYDASIDGIYKNAPVRKTLGGIFEGLGHSISNLTIHADDQHKTLVGLFASLTGTLRDLYLVNASVHSTADRAYVGALLGAGGGTIIECSASGTASAIGFPTQLGGLAGQAGTILRSHASVTVSGGDGDSGGLAAIAQNVFDSYATGNVTDATAAGLVASTIGLIDRSHATGQVTARGFAAGGLVANNSGRISQSYATGNVSGGEWAGGVAGGSNGDISNSYATGQTNGRGIAKVGGLVAQTNEGAAVRSSYAIGLVKRVHDRTRGGLVGRAEGTHFADNYWDVTTTGRDFDNGWGRCIHEKKDCEAGIVGQTDEQLRSNLPTGFSPSIWGQDPSINNGYPYLLANPPPN